MRLAEALEDQALACTALGSPLTASVLRAVGAAIVPGSALALRLADWPGDMSLRGASVPLRLAGALHGLVLTGRAPELAPIYAQAQSALPSGESPDAALLARALHAVFLREEAEILRWLDRAPQTNEVARAAVLIAAGHWLTARFGLPLVLSEVGASAGLNLLWDRFALVAGGRRFGPADAVLTLSPDWSGPLPPVAAPVIGAREGVDIAPLDPVRDALRLEAYVWADQMARLARVRAALALAAKSPPPVVAADAVAWLAQRLGPGAVPAGHVHLVCHTIAWQYLPADAQAHGAALIAEAGQRARADAPLAWFGMESDATPGSAALVLRLWPGALRFDLGRADFHGRWIAAADPFAMPDEGLI